MNNKKYTDYYWILDTNYSMILLYTSTDVLGAPSQALKFDRYHIGFSTWRFVLSDTGETIHLLASRKASVLHYENDFEDAHQLGIDKNYLAGKQIPFYESEDEEDLSTHLVYFRFMSSQLDLVEFDANRAS